MSSYLALFLGADVGALVPFCPAQLMSHIVFAMSLCFDSYVRVYEIC